MQRKYCSRCKTIKYTEEFPKDRHARDGFYAWCKVCNRQKHREYELEYEIKTGGLRSRKNRRRLGLRFKIFVRDNFTCVYCGRKPPEVKLQVDHVLPRSKGGQDSFDNFITACRDCNLGKSDIILNSVPLS